ncbi:hypothetical protein BIW11_03817 [Tropilaelaps mercedesae]|uniref:Uncharacterized protein n=1 Tax=Tropilaelaps mercedesae TaxID=418985 RepID=A0A1V9XFS6_9ACAR|nr:hypothetical protein BIW11_03817 [Tropilaelaps mercedesae]
MEEPVPRVERPLTRSLRSRQRMSRSRSTHLCST